MWFDSRSPREWRGEVVAVGEGVAELPAAERVACAGSLGAYAEERTLPADRLVKVPDADLFDGVGSGAARITTNQTFPLSAAPEAHRALDGRRTTGSTALFPCPGSITISKDSSKIREGFNAHSRLGARRRRRR